MNNPAAPIPLQDSSPVAWAFWRRCFALYIDIAILELVGLVLGILGFDQLAALNSGGLLLGLSLAVLYFGYFNSHLGQGQTLGKRWMKIRVVGQNGYFLPLNLSCFRAGFLSLLLFPFFKLALFAFNLDQWVRVGAFLPDLLVAVSLYLFLFNRRTRQTLHDLIFGTYVIQTTSSNPVKSCKIWPWHLFIALAVGVAIALSLRLNPPNQRPVLAPSALPLEQTLRQSLNLRSARLLSSTYTLNQTVQTRTLRVILEPYPGLTSADQLAAQAAKIIFAQGPEIRQFDTVGLTIQYGYRLGLATGYRKFDYRYCPRQGGVLDERFDASLIFKTPSAYHLILNLDRNYQPTFIKLPLVTTGVDPNDVASISFQPMPLGQCQSPNRKLQKPAP